MEVYAKFAAPTFAGGASKKGCPHGEHTNPWGTQKGGKYRSKWDGVDWLSPSKALGLFVERGGSRILFVKAEP